MHMSFSANDLLKSERHASTTPVADWAPWHVQSVRHSCESGAGPHRERNAQGVHREETDPGQRQPEEVTCRQGKIPRSQAAGKIRHIVHMGRMITYGERSLHNVIREFLAHYHRARLGGLLR